MSIRIDIVIPVYNSFLILSELIQQLSDFSSSTTYDVQVIFVDDGSVDDSFQLIRDINPAFPYQLIKLEKNYGQHAATAIGLSFCTAQYCVTMDDDLQHRPSDIPILINHMKEIGADVVYGDFSQKKHHAFRNLGSRILKKIVYKDKIDYEKVTSFRLMKLAIAQQFSAKRPPVGFIDEPIISSSRKVSAVEVSHHHSTEVKSRYSSMQLIRFALRIILFHSTFPLKFIIRLGLFSATLFFIIGCYFIYNRFVNEVPLGFSALIVSIFFTSGLILVALGIIAEYLRRIWEFQQGMSQVLIEQIHKNQPER